jgi:hypothetical protein
MDLADDSGDPPPAVNWSLVDDDQDWRRREGSKSAPPMLNVSGFPGADNMFFYRPDMEPSKPIDCRREEGYEELYRGPPERSHLPQPLSTSFQEFINSMTMAESPDATPAHSLQSSFSSVPFANGSFTSMLLKHTGSQHPPRFDKDRKGSRGEPLMDSPAMHPLDNGAVPIRIPGFGSSPTAQSLLLGTPPASLSSLGGEPYMVGSSPNAGGYIPPGLTGPQASWPRPTFTSMEEQAASSSRKKDVKSKGQRLTFQDYQEPAPPPPPPAARPKPPAPVPKEAADLRQGASHLHKDGRQQQQSKGAPGNPLERRLFPALEGEIDGHYSTIEDVTGNIYHTAKDQYGCRFLQKMLEDGNPQCIARILEEVYENSVELMTDPFGNYLMQKLVERCTDEQRTVIAQKVAPHLVTISFNMHGTRAVQTLIENLSNSTQVQIIIGALQDSVVPLIKDLNGNHVIQRSLQKFTPQDKQFVYDAAVPRCMDVATHRHGCCVIQRCIDHASEEQRMWLTDEIARNALTLVTDPFGNYVVQYVLDLNVEHMVRKVCAAFRGCFASLCMNKFSSNVMEKSLQSAPDDIQESFVAELMEPATLPKLLQDQYANYVVQTALTVSKPPQLTHLQEAIRGHIHLVRNTPYGKKIENKLNRGAGRSAGGGRNKPRGGGPGANGGGKGYGAPPHGGHQNHQPPRAMAAGPHGVPHHHGGGGGHLVGPGMPPVHMPPPRMGQPGPPGMMPPMGLEPGMGSWDDPRAQMYWT